MNQSQIEKRQEGLLHIKMCFAVSARICLLTAAWLILPPAIMAGEANHSTNTPSQKTVDPIAAERLDLNSMLTLLDGSMQRYTQLPTSAQKEEYLAKLRAGLPDRVNGKTMVLRLEIHNVRAISDDVAELTVSWTEPSQMLMRKHFVKFSRNASLRLNMSKAESLALTKGVVVWVKGTPSLGRLDPTVQKGTTWSLGSLEGSIVTGLVPLGDLYLNDFVAVIGSREFRYNQ